jgi:hypothetical protein
MFALKLGRAPSEHDSGSGALVAHEPPIAARLKEHNNGVGSATTVAMN